MNSVQIIDPLAEFSTQKGIPDYWSRMHQSYLMVNLKKVLPSLVEENSCVIKFFVKKNQ